MPWTLYKLVYRAEAPVHIGYHKLGFIQRTRYYILGRSLWGALTANLARILGTNNYEGIRKQIEENVRFTYLYPTLSEDGSWPLIPLFTDKGMKYGLGDEGFLAPEFERIFIHAYTQTALEPSSLTAEDGSLHETEYIAPTVEVDGKLKPVYFVGYIFLKNGAGIELSNQKDALHQIYVGGERKYGFGQVRLKGPLKEESGRLFGIFDWKEDGDVVGITIPKGKPIPAHLITDNAKAKLKGDIEPLVGREYREVKGGDQNTGFGQEISKCKLCWMPGSVITDKDTSFVIGEHGILGD